MFDATQFSWAGATASDKGGYHFEKNHAFFPFLPFVLHSLGATFGDTEMVIVNFFY